MTWQIGDTVEVLEDNKYWIDTTTGKIVLKWRFEDETVWPHVNLDETYPGPTKFKGTPTKRIGLSMWNATRAMNSIDGWAALRRNNGGWINWASNKNWDQGEVLPENPDPLPRTEPITSIGNRHRVLDRRNGLTRVAAYRYTDLAPVKFDPLMVCHFTSINKNGDIGNAPDGVLSYFPLLVEEEAWIPDERLKLYVEEPMPDPTDNLPLIRDISKHQAIYDMLVAKDNNVRLIFIRAAISYAYRDPFYVNNRSEAQKVNLPNASYHVLYPGENVLKQADNWYAVQDTVEGIARVSDFELDHLVPNEQKAEALWAMSDIVLARDGFRPIIYSRSQLINDWLSSWTQKMIDAHFYYLAQYWSDGEEHGYADGSELPRLPTRVSRDRVIIHQTSDVLPGFPGEAQSFAVDTNRWQQGDEAQMDQFILDTWGGTTPIPVPPPTVNCDNVLDEVIAFINTKKTVD